MGDSHHVLEVGGQCPVRGHRRPVVGKDSNRRPARIDHRFDRQNHPLLEHRSVSLLTEVGDLRLLVELTPNAVTHKLSNHRIPVFFSVAEL